MTVGQTVDDLAENGARFALRQSPLPLDQL